MEDQNAPATKADKAVQQDIGQLRSEVKQDIEQLRSEVSRGYDLVERMADTETRLLKAFYDFAQSNQQRVTVP